MAVSVTVDFSAARQLIEQLKSAKEKAVYVGFPAEFDEKVEGSENFNLASLAAVLEFGNEHIPSRPFLRQTLEENQENIPHFLFSGSIMAYLLRKSMND